MDPDGFEPSASAVRERRSTNLSYEPVVTPGGVPSELRTRSAIRTRTGAGLSRVPLPLGYPGIGVVLEPATGIEPASSALRKQCSTSVSYTGKVCALGAIRTRTGDVLNVVPLPVGLRGRALRAEDSNLDDPVQSRAGCRYLNSHQAGRWGSPSPRPEMTSGWPESNRRPSPWQGDALTC